MRRLLATILVLILAFSATHAQERKPLVEGERILAPLHLVPDSTALAQDTATVQYDTIAVPAMTQKQLDKLFWKPDPMRAVWLGAIVPGLGQIYNRSYWKLPIVYGGLMGCVYAIQYTNNQYVGYKTAYRDIYYDNEAGVVSNDPSKSYIAILPEGYTIDRMGGLSSYQSRLKEWQNKTRRYRDLSIAITVVVYALTLVDAYVDAQLYDFDISDDLTLNVYPQLYYDLHTQRTAEVKLALTF